MNVKQKKTVHLDEDGFHIGETMLCSKEGYTVYVRVDSINLDCDGVLYQ